MISMVEEFFSPLEGSKRAHAAPPFWFHSEMQEGSLDDNLFFSDEGQYPVFSLLRLNPQTFPTRQGRTAEPRARFGPAR
jgi:hypothetical protein